MGTCCCSGSTSDVTPSPATASLKDTHAGRFRGGAGHAADALSTRRLTTGAESRRVTKPRPTPPEGLPFRRARPGAVHLPPLLTAATGSRLHRHIDWALMQRDGWRDHLRVTVNVAVAELRLAGVSSFEIARVLTTAVVEHPSRPFYDAPSLLTRELRSATITKLMLRWMAGERTPRT
jgi:hypothetical protein